MDTKEIRKEKKMTHTCIRVLMMSSGYPAVSSHMPAIVPAIPFQTVTVNISTVKEIASTGCPLIESP